MTPLNYLTGAGPAAHSVVGLTWGLMVISVAVVLIVTGLVWAGIVRRGVRSAKGVPAAVPVRREGDGMRWLTIGVGISSVVLVISLVWTVAVLAQVSNPPTKPDLTIQVTGHQWWWQATYEPTDPARVFQTANEIHVPVGRPVRIELLSQDVIHSFWVPQLAGKTDTIPGRTNIAWIEADRPGVYWGQCTEYCGAQHAHMAFKVIADPPAAFEAWRQAQVQPAAEAASPDAAQGEQVFVDRCGACHTVRGTQAGGGLGPDLTHLMSRSTLASATIANTPAGLAGWIANPQGVKPGTLMPTIYLSGPELSSVRTYLETLR
jgi:cytochrome c oxidase subunit 2